MTARRVPLALVAVGGLVVLAHLVALAFLGMAAGDWLGGTVIGLGLGVLGGAHLVVPAAAAPGSRRTATGLGAVALAAGLGEGLAAGRVATAGGWLLVPWALTALAVGSLLPGTRAEKAGRLAAFGFASVLVAVSARGDVTGVRGFATALGLAAAGAAGAVLVGAAAHAVRGRLHAPVPPPA